MPKAQLPPKAIHPKTRAEWRAWLEQHHTQTKGAWPVSYRQATGKARFEYDEAMEEALCFGWIDDKPNWGGIVNCFYQNIGIQHTRRECHGPRTD